MSWLKRTPARLDLLQAVADGAVTHRREPHGASLARGRNFVDEWDRGPGHADGSPRRRAVTGRVASYDKAGLVELGPMPAGLYMPRLWTLTDAGRALLVEWGGTP